MMFFIVGGMSILSIYSSNNSDFDSYDKSGEFNRTFNKLANVENEVDDLRGNIEDADTDFGAFGVLNALISSGWQTLKLLFESFGFMDSVFDGLEAFFGVPAWIPTIIGLFITVMISFAIYSMIFQKDG